MTTKLKRREAKVAPAPRLMKGKRNRIKSVQPKRIDGQSDFTASTLLVFPTDPAGLCTGLRKELLKVATRVQGDPKKIALLKSTLGICMKHVDSKYKQTIEINKAGSLKSRSARIADRAAKEVEMLAELAKDDE